MLTQLERIEHISVISVYERMWKSADVKKKEIINERKKNEEIMKQTTFRK